MILPKRTKLRRDMRLCLFLIALLSLAFLVVSCSGKSPSSTDATLDASVASFWDVQASWDENYLTVARQTQEADLIVVGEVVKVDTSMWNSPDGKQWTPDEKETLPIVYTTFYVKPTQVLKGEPKWGTPVPFRVTGTIVAPSADSQSTSSRLGLGVGDTIVAFGSIEDRYGTGGVYKPAEAYWLAMEENSIWTEQDGQFVNKGHTKDPAERSLPLATLESEITALVSGAE
jgi:hypothetical protein